jgi:hypothetical protein
LPILALSQSSLDGWNSTKPVSQVMQPFRGKIMLLTLFETMISRGCIFYACASRHESINIAFAVVNRCIS